MFDVLTTRKVAERLGQSVRQVHYLVKKGELHPSGRLDPPTGALFFTEAEVERFLADREEAAS